MVEVFKPQMAHLHHLRVNDVSVQYDGFPRVADKVTDKATLSGLCTGTIFCLIHYISQRYDLRFRYKPPSLCR